MAGQPGRVVVVGAGPAGMALACLLARRGVGVTVLEAHQDFARAFRGEGLQRTDLVHDVVGQFAGADVQEAAAESGEVAVADVGADDDAGGGRLTAGPADHAGITGVESAGHVGA